MSLLSLGNVSWPVKTEIGTDQFTFHIACGPFLRRVSEPFILMYFKNMCTFDYLYNVNLCYYQTILIYQQQIVFYKY